MKCFFNFFAGAERLHFCALYSDKNHCSNSLPNSHYWHSEGTCISIRKGLSTKFIAGKIDIVVVHLLDRKIPESTVCILIFIKNLRGQKHLVQLNCQPAELVQNNLFLSIQLKQNSTQQNNDNTEFFLVDPLACYFVTYLQMLHYNEDISFNVLFYWNTEGHGDHVTVHLQSLISANPTTIVN